MYCSFYEEIATTDDQGFEDWEYEEVSGEILEYLVVQSVVHAVVRSGSRLMSVPLSQLRVGDQADCI